MLIYLYNLFRVGYNVYLGTYIKKKGGECHSTWIAIIFEMQHWKT